MLKVKIVNGTATTKYTIPLGLSGVTDGKTMTPKNHQYLPASTTRTTGKISVTKVPSKWKDQTSP